MNFDSFGDVVDWPGVPDKARKGLSYTDETSLRELPGTAPRQHGRRLSDKLLVAFHHACDLGDFEIANDLLRILEVLLTRKPLPQHAGRRRNMESLVAAHERLWQLRNPDHGK